MGISNSAVQMTTSTEGVSTISTGIATFTSLTENNGNGNYYCQVTGQELKSDKAELQVISFAVQPSDSWTIDGETAGFTVRVERFEWANYQVIWQKKVDSSWQNVDPSSDKYRVQQAKAKQWYTFINIPNYDSAEEAEWRVKLTFPNDDNKGLIGGDLISNSAFVKKAGETTIEFQKSSTLEGSTFTLKCTVTAKEKPSYMKIMFNGRRRREWEADDKMTVTFDNNLVTVSVEQEAKFWFSGKKIGCLTTVSNQIVSAETDFYTVTKSCPTLTRTNGEIILTDKLDGSNVVGKIATLKCDTESSYQPYKPPGGEAVTVVECLFSTGKYNEKLTTCNKVIAIDYSKLNVGVFFKG